MDVYYQLEQSGAKLDKTFSKWLEFIVKGIKVNVFPVNRMPSDAVVRVAPLIALFLTMPCAAWYFGAAGSVQDHVQRSGRIIDPYVGSF